MSEKAIAADTEMKICGRPVTIAGTETARAQEDLDTAAGIPMPVPAL